MLQRAFRYRLYPTAEQENLLRQFIGATRFVYNLCLEQRRDWWRPGRRFNLATQCLELTTLRAEVDWLGEAPVTPLQQAIRDLDRAFLAFFTGRARYPTPRKKGVNDRMRFEARRVHVEQGESKFATAYIPKVGVVRFRNTRQMRGELASVTVSKDALGWHISFACRINHEAPANYLPSVGIDRGVSNTLALSTGEMMSTPDIANLERRKKRAQRILARRRRGSNRYRKQRARLSRITAKIARIRADWQHRASTDIARRFGLVGLEDLDTTAMTASGPGKRSLNRSILAQGWNAFALKLAYKLEERGGTLIKVNPAYTSQECSACGTIDKANRESQAKFACRGCGFAAHADTNAAHNILRRSTAVVEGSGYAPVETRTDHALAA